METIADRYRRLAREFAARVAEVPADRWASPSPCEGWSALDVVRHVVDSHGLFLGLVGRELGPVPALEDDPLAAFVAARDVVQGALDDPDRAAESFEGSMGRMTFAEAIDRFISFDLLVHGWDLARAAGLDERLDPDEVHRALDVAAGFGDALRGPGVCGPPIEVPATASEQDRLLAFLGRRS